ncbi:hypothetical protein K8R14_04855 [bacterium]|nr:hypothetical protein [bacterium]
MQNREIIKKELEVMFSKDTQPIWFRITKWLVFIGVGYLLYETKWFWVWVIGIATAGTIMHIIYRWKTKVWTKSWGRWTKR